MWKKRVAVVLALLLVTATFYAATVDDEGEFAPTTDVTKIVHRISTRVNGVGKEAQRQKKALDPPKSKNVLRNKQRQFNSDKW